MTTGEIIGSVAASGALASAAVAVIALVKGRQTRRRVVALEKSSNIVQTSGHGNVVIAPNVTIQNIYQQPMDAE